MAGRKVLPRNAALRDQCAAVLRDIHPEKVTSSELAEKVGGTYTMWDQCRDGQPFRFADGTFHRTSAGEVWIGRCRALDNDRRFPVTHHPGGPGQADQDSWEIPLYNSHLNPILNRMARDGDVAKFPSGTTRSCYWQWAGDPALEASEETVVLAAIEAAWILGEVDHG